MSRIGNRILSLPANVTLSTDGNVVTVKGPKGELSTKINKNITVTVEGNEVKLTRKMITSRIFMVLQMLISKI